MTSLRRSPTSASTALGLVAWLLGPFIPWGRPPAFGSLEHTFMAMPLVLAPVALALLGTMIRSAPSLTLARRAQPLAAVVLLVASTLDVGAPAGALAAPWLVVAFLVAIAVAGAVRRGLDPELAGTSVVAAAVFLPVGAAWLLLSRLGVRPAGLAPTTVMLAATHFHFSGFVLQTLMAATDVQALRRRWQVTHRVAAVAAIVAIVLIAAGNLSASVGLKAVGVATMVAATLSFVVVTAAVAFAQTHARIRGLLAACAACGGTAMVLAGVYGFAEVTGRAWLGIPAMVVTHGLLNVFGFGLLGLSAHLWRNGEWMPSHIRASP